MKFGVLLLMLCLYGASLLAQPYLVKAPPVDVQTSTGLDTLGTTPAAYNDYTPLVPFTAYWVDATVGGGWIMQTPEHRQAVPLGGYFAKSVRLAIQPRDLYGTLYNGARYGLAFYSASFDTRAVGAPYAIFPWYQLAFVRPHPHQKFSFGHMGGFGVAWNFVPYNALSPEPNLYLGSKFNCYLELGLYATYYATPRVHISVSSGLKHFSDGSFKKPNLGINMVPFTLSVQYQLNDQPAANTYMDYAAIREHIPLHRRHWRFNIALGAGVRQNEPNTPQYSKYTLIAHALYQWSYQFRIGAGFDFFVTPNPQERNGVTHVRFNDWASPAVLLGAEWVIHQRVSIPIGLGVYVWPNNPNNGEELRYYERIGVKMDVTRHLYASFGIKAHKGVADFFELSVGCSLHGDPNSYKVNRD